MLYPIELLAHVQKLFNCTAPADERSSNIRRRTLYPGGVRGIYRNDSILQGSRIRTVRLSGEGCSILLNYWRMYKNYSIVRLRRMRDRQILGGGPSILVRYGDIYRNDSILQGSRIRTIRFLGETSSLDVYKRQPWGSP